MLTHSTLYLLQSDHAQCDQKIQELALLVAAQDAVVLMGDAVLHLDNPTLRQFNSCYVLTSDLDILPEAPAEHFQQLSYTAFAQLVLGFKRCISLK